MMKNEYRRSLIMLRPHRQGYSGHVRLERRTLMGSMYFVISVPGAEGELCAALIRRDREGAYYAVRLGMLRSDGRGQATLAYSFDPRNIDGFALEDYQLIVVMLRTEENCDVALSGNVNGSQEISWNSVRAAACGVCEEECRPSCDLCGQGSTPIQPRTEIVEKLEEAAEVPKEISEDVPETIIEETVDRSEGDHLPAEIEWMPEEEKKQQKAGEMLGIDMSVPWPGTSESLRTLFSDQPPQELMLNDGHTYVRAAMPQDSGYPHVEVGVKAENGAPVSVAYALPAHFSAEPPAGLEAYRWKGGAADGWWVVYTDAETGRPLEECSNSDTN